MRGGHSGDDLGAAIRMEACDDLGQLLGLQGVNRRRGTGELQLVPAAGGEMQRVPGDHLVGQVRRDASQAEASHHRREPDVDRDDPKLGATLVERDVADTRESPARDVDDLRIE